MFGKCPLPPDIRVIGERVGLSIGEDVLGRSAPALQSGTFRAVLCRRAGSVGDSRGVQPVGLVAVWRTSRPARHRRGGISRRSRLGVRRRPRTRGPTGARMRRRVPARGAPGLVRRSRRLPRDRDAPLAPVETTLWRVFLLAAIDHARGGCRQADMGVAGEASASRTTESPRRSCQLRPSGWDRMPLAIVTHATAATIGPANGTAPRSTNSSRRAASPRDSGPSHPLTRSPSSRLPGVAPVTSKTTK